jgi:ABC-type transport system involved in cytochrome bd biosynthesis fused ATPase/permease subunit
MKKTFTTITWVIRLVYQNFPLLLISSVLLQTVLTIIPFAENYFFSHLLDNLIQLSQQNQSPWISTLLFLVTIQVIRTILANIRMYIDRVFGFKLDSFLKRLFTFKSPLSIFNTLKTKILQI